MPLLSFTKYIVGDDIETGRRTGPALHWLSENQNGHRQQTQTNVMTH